MVLAIVGMIVVAVSLAAMIVTDSAAIRQSHPAVRTAVRGAWLAVVIIGWGVVGYLAVATPGGLDAAWSWVQGQSLPMQVAMWLLLLPWMGALWLWQTSLAEWLRFVLIIGLALLTLGLSIRELRPKR